ncbi:unnamed protein product [Rotaria sordida]|uniref:Uncharacterized protein n=1 Tax=Rotaria sordida TaxID=392033 RepID=A0A814WAC8_9BILA|nr:unnamed protein product [Rotaria sordida]CAF1534155.1 unnamed protein product [Rotaria sordida]
MTGGSFKNRESTDSGKNQNQKEIESKEVHIVMNWLCNSWLGHENVIMTDNLDESTLQQINKSELESAERFGRSCIINMLYYRMFSTVRWVDIYFEEVLFLRSFSTPIKKARRILGRMYFDTQPLQGNQETVNFHDSEEEEALKEKQFQLSIDVDRNEVTKKSIKRFTELIKKTKNNDRLQVFYRRKLQVLEQIG